MTKEKGGSVALEDQVHLAGWATPHASENENRGASRPPSQMNGTHGTSLPAMPSLAGWPSETASLADKGVRSEAGAIIEAIRTNGADLAAKASLAGWGTPSARDMKDAGAAFEADPSIVEVEGRLPWQAAMAGWVNPTVADHKRNYTYGNHKPGVICPSLAGQALGIVPNTNGDLGTTASSSPAGTEKSAGLVLNPRFSLWLMGYPKAWFEAGMRAALSTLLQKKRRGESKS